MNIAIAQALIWFGEFFTWMIIIRAVMSWLPIRRDGIFGTIFGLVSAFTEPIVSPIRRLIQRSPLGGGGMMIDFSPMLAFLVIRVLTSVLVNFLVSL